MDNKYGGAHSRSAVTSYLAINVEPMLRDGRAREAVRNELVTAAAELHQLAGWMAYDTGHADVGRTHLRTALRLCQQAGDDGLSAEMLAAMSHHAAFHGAPESAVDLALAARQTAKRAGLPALQAETAVMEAHGLALQRDMQRCLAAMRDAENAFSEIDTADVPSWLRYFDGAYLSAKFAHTFRDLGRPQEAERFARRSLEMSAGYERGRLFNTALLASILADMGRPEEACAHGALAV
ncbi:MAG TPA: XRE family transcriptional regulator [Actinophytocola sp.]|uniref:XRE family transcriptional regulator n=1 Tax=Actinophytocola sp. TaxID=1872138 RepID=UPI002DDCB215|nr:XRE family transcriptional regulator [Actinophytocola sp.]HEV2783869.1 XRE family transcriptional regulator [Actinophytocola sp.]